MAFRSSIGERLAHSIRFFFPFKRKKLFFRKKSLRVAELKLAARSAQLSGKDGSTGSP